MTGSRGGHLEETERPQPVRPSRIDPRNRGTGLIRAEKNRKKTGQDPPEEGPEGVRKDRQKTRRRLPSEGKNRGRARAPVLSAGKPEEEQGEGDDLD